MRLAKSRVPQPDHIRLHGKFRGLKLQHLLHVVCAGFVLDCGDPHALVVFPQRVLQVSKLLGVQILVGQSGLGFAKCVQYNPAIMRHRLLLLCRSDLDLGGQPAPGVDRQGHAQGHMVEPWVQLHQREQRVADTASLEV